MPAVTATYAGFVNGDTASSLTSSRPAPRATSSSAVGTYATSCSGAVDANYTIFYVAGADTVTPAPSRHGLLRLHDLRRERADGHRVVLRLRER